MAETTKSKRKKFTVIGFYEETGQTFAYHILATDPHQAIALAVGGDYIDMCDPDDPAVLGAVNGWVNLTASAEDSGNLAYACDLVQDHSDEVPVNG